MIFQKHLLIQGLVQTLLPTSFQPNASLTYIGLAAPASSLVGIILNVGGSICGYFMR